MQSSIFINVFRIGLVAVLVSVVLVILMMTNCVCRVHKFKVLSEHLRQCRHSNNNAPWLLLTFMVFFLFICLQMMVYVVGLHTSRRPSILVDLSCLLAFLGWVTLVHFDHSKLIDNVTKYPEKVRAIAMPVKFSMHTYGVLLMIISLLVIFTFIKSRFSQFCYTQCSLHSNTEEDGKEIDWICTQPDTVSTSKVITYSRIERLLGCLLILEGMLVFFFLVFYLFQHEFLYTTLEYIVIFMLYLILSVVFYVGIEMPYSQNEFSEKDGCKVFYLVAAFFAVALVPVSQQYT